jgi:hypothetical protein
LDILSDTEDLENQAAELAYKLRNEERHKWAICFLVQKRSFFSDSP